MEDIGQVKPQSVGSEESRTPSVTESRTSTLLLVAIVSALVGAAVASLTALFLYAGFPEVTPGGTASQIKPVTAPLSKSDTPVTAVAKKVQPSIVNIRTQAKISDGFHQGQILPGVGSGIIIRSDGYILTNFHVVEDARSIWVTVGSDENVRGTLVGQDWETDIAVIKVDMEDLPVADLGASKNLQVGETVVALGSPMGLEQSVTHGVVSALNRVLSLDSRTFVGLIQTDAAINPGNSGGALTNAAGQVIGVTTLIETDTGSFQGIGLAIPIDSAREVAEQLISGDEVSHAYVGIKGSTVDAEVAERKKLPVEAGALIEEVSPKSPAGRAGIEKDDIIVEFDGEAVKDMDHLVVLIRSLSVGDEVEITYFRGKVKKTVDLKLAPKPVPSS